MLGRGGVQDRHVAIEGVGWQPVGPGGIAQPDPHLLCVWPGVAERVQPRWGARAAAAGVNDQVGAEEPSALPSARRSTRAPVTRRPSGVVASPTTSRRSRSRALGRARTRART